MWKKFYRRTPDVEVTNEWQEWIVNDGVVNETDHGKFTFNRYAPTSGPPARRSRDLQALSTTAPPSNSRTVVMPPTADLVEELMAYQRTTPSWRAWEWEVMGWEGTAKENVKKCREYRCRVG
jgi:hypothetical protein